MIDLGTVKPGATIRIPFSTFDKDDGSSITMTAFVVGDILIYKDGSATERASTAGFTATTDFDTKTGKQLIVIDLADNTTAGFFAAGSEYLIAVDAVTVDAVTTGGWVARFRIGYEGAILDTTIATLASQTSFTLTAGPAEDDALNGCIVLIHDVASAVQAGFAVVQDYTGSTKTVTLTAGTTFTAAATDNISLFPPVNAAYGGAVAYTATRGLCGTAVPAAAADAAGGLPISDAGGLDLDAKLANTNEITVARMGALTDWIDGGRLDLIVDAILVDTGTTLDGRIPAALVGGRMDASVGAMAANVLTAAATAADFGTEIATAIWTDTTAGDFTVALSIGKSVMNGVSLGTGLTINAYTGNTAQTGDSFALIGATGSGLTSLASQASVNTIDDLLDTELAALITTVGVAGAGLTDLGGFSTTAKGQIQTEAEDALAAYHVVMVKTTIATLASQTSFTLTAGSADNDAYNGCEIVIEDASTAAQKAVGVVDDYTGATKTVTLRTDPAVFTMAATDIVTIRPSRSLKSTVDNRTLDVTATGAAGVDWSNIENPTSTVGLTNTTVGIVTLTTTATNVTTVNGLAADVITAAAIATDAFGALELAAGAGTEIASAVRTELTVELALIDATVSSRMATYTQPTGFLAATFPATVASTTNITAAAGCALTSAYDLYHADVQFTRDQTNTTDEYLITWFKNGARQTSGITVPTIQVVKRSDGTDLIASSTPTQVATTGTYKYDATGASRMTVGEACLVIVTATIDASTRSFSKLIGRDSS